MQGSIHLILLWNSSWNSARHWPHFHARKLFCSLWRDCSWPVFSSESYQSILFLNCLSMHHILLMYCISNKLLQDAMQIFAKISILKQFQTSAKKSGKLAQKLARKSVPNFNDGFSYTSTWCQLFNAKLKLRSKHLASIPQGGGSASSRYCSDFHTSRSKLPFRHINLMSAF